MLSVSAVVRTFVTTAAHWPHGLTSEHNEFFRIDIAKHARLFPAPRAAAGPLRHLGSDGRCARIPGEAALRVFAGQRHRGKH